MSNHTDRHLRAYCIIRMYRNDRKPRTIRSSLTEAECQAHCSDPKTSTASYFDGYDYMKGVKPANDSNP